MREKTVVNKQINEILKLHSLEAEPNLLGWILVRHTPKGTIKLRIVETEAYHQGDPASHSFRGQTARTAPMFEAGGRLYVYFTYGIHHCLNIVVGAKGVGEAVLLRAGEPLKGIEIMRKNRFGSAVRGPTSHNLANGPGKLTQAFCITRQHSGHDLTTPPLYVADEESVQTAENGRVLPILVTTRIGIKEARNMPLRFYLKGNPFVSKQ